MLYIVYRPLFNLREEKLENANDVFQNLCKMAPTIRYPAKQFQFINFSLIFPFMIMAVQKVILCLSWIMAMHLSAGTIRTCAFLFSASWWTFSIALLQMM